LKKKNLLEIGGVPMIVRAMRKVAKLSCFDEVWVNSESEVFGDLARSEGISFHKRPEVLGNNVSTSEQFVQEFLEKHPCDYLVQVHSIAPLLTSGEASSFVERLVAEDYNTLLSGMDATQELEPLQRISWTITGWKAATYTETFASGGCATFHGKVGFFPLSRPSGMVVKTDEDYRIVKALAEAGFGD
jgi:CMP-N-acetylneuraminic acid synthetase